GIDFRDQILSCRRAFVGCVAGDQSRLSADDRLSHGQDRAGNGVALSWVANAVAAGARHLAGVSVRWVDCRPESRQRAYFANHTSHLDFVVLWLVLPRELRQRTRPVAARDYWQAGIRRKLAVNVFNAVLVDRRVKSGANGSNSAGHALNDMLTALGQR